MNRAGRGLFGGWGWQPSMPAACYADGDSFGEGKKRRRGPGAESWGEAPAHPGPGRVCLEMHGHSGHGHGFGKFGRARRGMIKAAVFAALAEGPMHGYQIMQRIEGLSGGAWRPSPGSVYPTLQEFEDRGLVRGEEIDGKRVYSLTETGAAEADKLRDTEGKLPWMTAEGDVGARMKLRQAVGSLAAATRQVGVSGSDETVEKTLDILADARRRIYAMLADAE
jgi:DNA-binding PadR family transcriptional regulator